MLPPWHMAKRNRIEDLAGVSVADAVEVEEEGVEAGHAMALVTSPPPPSWPTATSSRAAAARFSSCTSSGGCSPGAGEPARRSPLRRAVEVQPAPDAVLDLARALDRAGKSGEALAAYRRAIELAPRSYTAHYGLAQLLARSGEREAAQQALATYERLYAAEQERTRRAGWERARLDHGWELLDAGEVEAAARHFAGLAESAESLAGLAAARSRLGDHRGAVAALERAVTLAPERTDLRRLLAEERLAAGADR